MTLEKWVTAFSTKAAWGYCKGDECLQPRSAVLTSFCLVHTNVCISPTSPKNPTRSKGSAIGFKFLKAGLFLMLSPFVSKQNPDHCHSAGSTVLRPCVYPLCQTTKLAVFFQRCCRRRSPVSLLHLEGTLLGIAVCLCSFLDMFTWTV